MFASFPSVVVVGAGPAGSSAARELAASGIPVRLLDRCSFPRQKPCGGAISMRALRRFPHLAPAIQSIATHRVSRLFLEGPDGDAAVVESDEPAVLLIRRLEFDQCLVELAVAAGAELTSGVDIVRAVQSDRHVTLTARDGREFRAAAVIAADGVNGVVARRIGLNDGWPSTAVAVDMMEESPRHVMRDIDPSTLWVAYGYAAGNGDAASRGAPEGYAYVFPKRDHVNVGIGYVLSYFRRHVAQAPYALQRSFVDGLRRRGVLAGESRRDLFTPFLIPVAGPLRRVAAGRVLAAGDAGGFVNGFTAEGIYYAMLTGELAARAVVNGARRGSFDRIADDYARSCHRAVGAELRDSVLLQRFLFSDRRRLAAIVRAAPEAAVTRAVLDYAIGRRDYRSVRRRVLSAFPGVGFRLALEWLRGGRLER